MFVFAHSFRDYCDARYQSGECNKMCDNKECEFDGGDCDSQDTRKLVCCVCVCVYICVRECVVHIM